MKYLLLFLTLFAFDTNVSANAIDSLKTDNDVLKFVLKVDEAFVDDGISLIYIDPTDTLLKRVECSDMARQSGIKTWQKADLTGDKRTDLIVMIRSGSEYHVVAYIENGDNQFKSIIVSWGMGSSCQLAKPVILYGQPMLLVYSIELRYKNNKFDDLRTGQTDTLIYRNGNFVEYNAHPDSFSFKSIKFDTFPGMGFDNVFKLTLNANRDVFYEYDTIVPHKMQIVHNIFKAKISSKTQKQIRSFINYICVKKLQDDYQVAESDNQTARLKFEFKDGTTKSIYDYGMVGTHGLTGLYHIISELKKSESWVKVN